MADTDTLSRLIDTFLRAPEFRDTLMSMLRPMDIVRLVAASGIRTTLGERKRYMAVWRQICFDMRWVSALKERNSSVTIVGNELRRLHSALRCGDHTFNIDQLHLIIVVGGTGENRSLEQELRIAESFDTTVRWHDIRAPRLPVFNVDQRPTDVQTSIFSHTRNSWMSFDDTWAEVLYERRTLPMDPLGAPYSRLFDVLETEFHELDSDVELATFSPKRMHYVVKPWRLEEYTTRVFITPQRGCLAILKKGL